MILREQVNSDDGDLIYEIDDLKKASLTLDSLFKVKSSDMVITIEEIVPNWSNVPEGHACTSLLVNIDTPINFDRIRSMPEIGYWTY